MAWPFMHHLSVKVINYFHLYLITNFIFSPYIWHSFVVKSSHLMKRCNVGGGSHDCYNGDPCKSDDDCFGNLVCNEHGYCVHDDPGNPPCC